MMCGVTTVIGGKRFLVADLLVVFYRHRIYAASVGEKLFLVQVNLYPIASVNIMKFSYLGLATNANAHITKNKNKRFIGFCFLIIPDTIVLGNCKCLSSNNLLRSCHAVILPALVSQNVGCKSNGLTWQRYK